MSVVDYINIVFSTSILDPSIWQSQTYVLVMASNEELFEKIANEGPVSAEKLLTEDEILTEQDKKKPDAKECDPNLSGTTSKPKKACANCTCGLADELEKEAKNQIDDAISASRDTSAPKTSCGSCYLGDAFRCASCPYRGMPAFNPGEKVTIDLGSDE